MKKHLQHLKNEKGLTLVELLAVIVILAVVAVIGFVMIGKVIENSKKDAHISQAIQMIESAKLQALSLDVDNHTFEFNDLLKDGEIFRDPWSKAEYVSADLTSAEVVKAGTTYTVNGFNSKTADKCNIDGKDEQELLEKNDRDDICGITP